MAVTERPRPRNGSELLRHHFVGEEEDDGKDATCGLFWRVEPMVLIGILGIYPLVNLHNYGKSLFSMGKSTISISMAIFQFANCKSLPGRLHWHPIPMLKKNLGVCRGSTIQDSFFPIPYTKCFASGSPDSWESLGKSLGFRTSIRCFRRVPGFPNFCACLLKYQILYYYVLILFITRLIRNFITAKIMLSL